MLIESGQPAPGTFEAISREWYDKHAPSWASSHSEKVIRRLERDVFPWIGSQQIVRIKPADVLAVLRRIEARGALETTHRAQQNCSQVFRYAVAIGLIESDPSRDLRGALPPWRPQHYPTLTDPRKVGQLLRDIANHRGGLITRCAMQLSPLLFVRPGELRQAEWAELIWTLPSGGFLRPR